MRSKSFILSIFVFFIPFLFAVNILRMELGQDNGYLSLTGFLQVTSEIDFSFAGTYVAIAEAGAAWDKLVTSDPDIWNLVWAIYYTLYVPYMAINEVISVIYDCVLVFVKFVGFLPS